MLCGGFGVNIVIEILSLKSDNYFRLFVFVVSAGKSVRKSKYDANVTKEKMI